MKKIYLIDFDGTITSKDSFIIFTLFSTNFINFLKYWVGVILFFQFQENSFLKESFFKNFKGIDANIEYLFNDINAEWQIIGTWVDDISKISNKKIIYLCIKRLKNSKNNNHSYLSLTL